MIYPMFTIRSREKNNIIILSNVYYYYHPQYYNIYFSKNRTKNKKDIEIETYTNKINDNNNNNNNNAKIIRIIAVLRAHVPNYIYYYVVYLYTSYT